MNKAAGSAGADVSVVRVEALTISLISVHAADFSTVVGHRDFSRWPFFIGFNPPELIPSYFDEQ